MADRVSVENRANLPHGEFDAVARAVERHATMERALAWFAAHSPRLVPEDLIVQDEFSFDLLVPYRNGLYLCYDIS